MHGVLFFCVDTVHLWIGPGCFAADVTSVGDPSDMVALYVFHNISQMTFFSTHFTYQCFSFCVPYHHAFSSVLYH